MTFEELLKASANGFPEVRARIGPAAKVPDNGYVLIISNRNNRKGCEVLFPGKRHSIWFEDCEDRSIKVKNYLQNLILAETKQGMLDDPDYSPVKTKGLTFKKLLKISANGMPRVEMRFNESEKKVGQIDRLVDKGIFRGCSVSFSDEEESVWFKERVAGDSSEHYLDELTIIL